MNEFINFNELKQLQYKDAFHYGRIATYYQSLNTIQSSRRKEHQFKGPKIAFRQPFHADHFVKSSQFTNKSTSFLEGLGITIDDEGHLIIAEWKNNQIHGKYFMFKPNLIEQLERSSSCNGISQYGTMKNGNLQGQNFLCTVTGASAKGVFSNHKIIGKCYVFHNRKANTNDQAQQKIECQIIHFEMPNSQNSLKKQDLLLLQKQKGVFQNIQTETFYKPSYFLEEMIKNYQKQTDSLKYPYFAKIQLSENQCFVGFVSDTQIQQQPVSNNKANQRQKYSKRFSGFGVVLKDEWPIKYGNFQNNKLEGLGRSYETQVTVHDGYFIGGVIMEGFIIDHFNNRIHFGTNNLLNNPNSQPLSRQNKFIITQSFQHSQYQYLLQYKKKYHLKSFHFTNSFFNSPKLIHRSPWPLKIVNMLFNKNTIHSLIKSFNPAFTNNECSSIDNIVLTSENRVERQLMSQLKDIKQARKQSRLEQKLNKDKSTFLKMQIQNHLIDQNDNSKNELNSFIVQYEDIKRKKQQSHLSYSLNYPQQQPRIDTLENKQTLKSHYNYTPKNLDRKSLSGNKNIEKPKDFPQLIEQYKECQTERKYNESNSIFRGISAQKKSPWQVKSKRKLIEMDHRHFILHGNSTDRYQTRKTSRGDLDLDKIYHQYLKY